jgi:hypothetical protein
LFPDPRVSNIPAQAQHLFHSSRNRSIPTLLNHVEVVALKNRDMLIEGQFSVQINEFTSK